tara:strand:- start:267 stop:1817 length:1551 start_codon:yes stop_codon:yes gene_type:complete
MSKIPFLNHLDLRSVSELQNAILHKTTTSSASNVEGKLLYDTGSNTIQYYNGSSWISLTGQDANTFRTVKVDTNNDGSANATLGATENLQLIGGSNITLAESAGVVTINAGAATTVGKTNSTQRSGSIELIAGTNVSIAEDGTTGHFTFTSTDTQPLTTEQVQDIVGAMVSSNTETRIGVTYDDTNGKLDFVADDMNYSLNLSKLNTVTSAMTGTDTLTFGDSGDDTQVTIKGNLTVIGTTTTNNVETVSTSNGVQFEGTAADGHDAILKSVVASSDKTYTLPNITGHIPILTNDPGTTAISATATELNYVDGVTSAIQGQIDGKEPSSAKLTELATMAQATANAIADLTSGEISKIDGTTAGTVVASKAVVVDSNKDVTGFRNLTLTGEIDAGSLDVSGNADIDGTLEADAITVNGTALNTVIDGRIDATEFKGSFPSSATTAGDTITITHSLATRDVVVQFYANVADITGNGSGDVTQYEEVKLNNTRATTNTITVVPLVPLAANALRVLIKEL